MAARPPTRLLLVRHGQARAHDDSYGGATPLTELGRRQAEAVARRLAGEGAAALYSSPMRRALETAGPVARATGCEPVVVDALAELDLGDWTPLVAAERTDLLAWQPDHRLGPDGETLRGFAERVASAMDGLVVAHGGTTVVVVAHAGVLDAALRWAQGIGPDRPWQAEFTLPNASLTVIRAWPDGRIPGGAPRFTDIEAVGDTRHLGDLATDL